MIDQIMVVYFPRQCYIYMSSIRMTYTEKYTYNSFMILVLEFYLRLFNDFWASTLSRNHDKLLKR